MKAKERRMIVAEAYLCGITQMQIAEKLGVTQATISNDLKALRKAWQKSALVDIDQMKEQELAKIDRLESEYWQAWEASKGVKRIKTGEKRAGQEGRASVREEDRTGDPRYLRGVMDCIDKRCKILGIEAPIRRELSGPKGGPIETKAQVYFYIPDNSRGDNLEEAVDEVGE
jgi:predicted transcriptional regulator